MITSTEVGAGLIAAIGGVVVFLGLNQVLNPLLDRFSIPVLLVGVALILFARQIQRKTGIKDEVTSTAGGVLIFLGMHTFLEEFVVELAVPFIVVGILLILFRRQIWRLTNLT